MKILSVYKNIIRNNNKAMLENFEQFGGFSKENEICIIFVGFPNFEIISKFQTAFYNFLGNVSYLFLYIKCVCLKQQILNI